MSLASAYAPECSGQIPRMHYQQMSTQIRAPTVGNPYIMLNETLSPATGVHVSVDGVPFQYQLTDDDLMKVFSRYGPVSHITVLDEGGAAIVQFVSPADAGKATAALDGKVLNGVHGALRVTLFPSLPMGQSANRQYAPQADKYANKKFTCRFEVSPDIDREFHVSKRIIGQKGINMKKIVSSLSSMDAAKLRLRGRGSGFLEGPYKQESDEPLHLCVSCRDAESYAIVLREVTMLFENVYADYAAWCNERGNQVTLPKVVPRDHPADAYVPGSFGPRSLYPPSWTAATPSPYSTSAINTPPEYESLDVALIERMIEERNEARRVCNFKEADRLRDLLRSHGIGLMDEPGARGKGSQVTTWKMGGGQRK